MGFTPRRVSGRPPLVSLQKRISQHLRVAAGPMEALREEHGKEQQSRSRLACLPRAERPHPQRRSLAKGVSPPRARPRAMYTSATPPPGSSGRSRTGGALRRVNAPERRPSRSRPSSARRGETLRLLHPPERSHGRPRQPQVEATERSRQSHPQLRGHERQRKRVRIRHVVEAHQTRVGERAP